MKILIAGILVFFIWSTLSTYIYVCKIKGLCYVSDIVAIREITPIKVVSVDTISKVLLQKQAIIPQTLLIYFAFDNSEFISTSESVKYFEETMKYMSQKSEAGLIITGHTDAIGTDDYNYALGYRRAKSVQSFFESKGMPPAKITIDSKGEKEPAYDNNTIEGRSKNRRTVITIKL